MSSFSRRFWILLVISVFTSLGLPITPFAPSKTQIASARVSKPLLQQIEQQIYQIAALTGGTLGVSAIELTSGQRISISGNEPFPRASTYKVPIALQLLDQVSQGKLQLNEQISIQPQDLRPISVISTYFNLPQLTVSLRNLMDLMLIASDNTASDLLLVKIRGAAAITNYLSDRDLNDIRVDRTEAELWADEFTFTLPPESRWSL